MRYGLVALMLSLGILGGGCYRHTYFVAGTTPEAAPREWTWHHHLLWGLVNLNAPVPVNAICPQGVSRVDDWIGPGQAIISWLTAGIYTPTTVRVYCRLAHMPVTIRLVPDQAALARMKALHPRLEAQLVEALDVLEADAAAREAKEAREEASTTAMH